MSTKAEAAAQAWNATQACIGHPQTWRELSESFADLARDHGALLIGSRDNHLEALFDDDTMIHARQTDDEGWIAYASETPAHRRG